MAVALAVGCKGGGSATYGLVPLAALCPADAMFVREVDHN
jgi:hypothetical protein